MKKTRIVSCILICLIISMVFVGCGATKEDAIGLWKGSYDYNGNQIDRTMIVNADGSYEETVYYNGSFGRAGTGTWEVKNGKLVLKESGKPGTIEFSLSDNKLKNADGMVLLQKVVE